MGTFSRKLGVMVGLFGLLALPALASAQTLPLSVVRAKVGSSITRYEDAARRAGRTKNEQATLEHRIAALKRLKESRPLASDAELETLLAQSLDADRALARDTKAMQTERGAAELAVKDGIQKIDLEIRRLVPALKTGAIESRAGAARRLSELRDAREDLKTELASLRDDNSEGRAIARYKVEIEPLDGPSELYEKADVVADARDKIQKKRSAIAELIREARQEREIAQAAHDFATDVTLFDEESRTGRVLKKGSAPAAQVNLGTSVQEKTASSGGDKTAQNAAPPPAVPLQGPGGAAAPPPADPNAPARDSDPSSFNAAEDATHAPTAPTSPAVATTAPSPTVPAVTGAPISKEMNPSLLMSLRVEELAKGNLDMATLERLVAELQRLDTALAQQAKDIRDRAQKLEADEAKALGKH